MGELKLPEATETRVRIREVFNTSKKEKYIPAGIGKRFFALIIDCMISYICSAVVGILVFNKIFSMPYMQIGMSLLFSAIVVPLWYCYLLTEHGYTPGKKMLKLRVVREDHGHKLSFQKIMLRETVGKFLSFIFFGLGYFTALGNPGRATWHDKLAKTRVVEFK